MTFGKLKLLTLSLAAIATVSLTGCATFDKTPDGYADLVNTKTDYDPRISYAMNVMWYLTDIKGSGFRYEAYPVTSDSYNTAPDNYYEDDSVPAPEEATESWGFKPVETKIVKKTTSGNQGAALAMKSASIGADLMGSRAGSLWNMASDFFSIGKTKVTEVEPERVPRHDYLSDQLFVYLHKSDFENEAAAEDFLYDTLKTAFEKGGAEAVKGGVNVTVERGCERTKITGRLNDKAKTVWMELYLARLSGTNSEVVPKCAETASAHRHQTAVMPIFMLRPATDDGFFRSFMAWEYSIKAGSHLFLTGKGSAIAAKAVKYFPENAFVYIAPRREKGQLRAPYLLDKFGRHEFGHPAQNTIPAWYNWISEKYPDTEYRN